MCRHRLSQEETEGGCACVPRVVRDARDEKDAQDAHLVRLVSLNQPYLELCGGSSPLNGTSLCEVADVGRFLFLGFDSDCFGCYAFGFLAACASGFLAPLPSSQLSCDGTIPLGWGTHYHMRA